MPKYAELVYNGFWISPEREALQAAIDKTQEHCSGTVRLKLYKGEDHSTSINVKICTLKYRRIKIIFLVLIALLDSWNKLYRLFIIQ